MKKTLKIVAFVFAIAYMVMNISLEAYFLMSIVSLLLLVASKVKYAIYRGVRFNLFSSLFSDIVISFAPIFNGLILMASLIALFADRNEFMRLYEVR